MSRARIWREAQERFVREGQWKADRTKKDEARILAKVAVRLDRISLPQISADLVDELVKLEHARNAGVRTINRMLEVVRAVLRAAVEWGWLKQAPRVRLLKKPARRLRWITYPQAMRLLDELPDHQRRIVSFALETGLRKSNVLGLRWDQIDLGSRLAWIHADQAKGGEAIGVPLSRTALQLLRSRKNGQDYCFTYRGRRLKECNTKAWRSALERAGIEGFRWHDLRHTWASWHAQQGTPKKVLQDLGGWKTPGMVDLYAHLAVEHLRPYVDQMHRRMRQARKSPH